MDGTKSYSYLQKEERTLSAIRPPPPKSQPDKVGREGVFVTCQKATKEGEMSLASNHPFFFFFFQRVV